MFCRNCGSQYDDQAQFCPNCGTPTQPTAPTQSYNYEQSYNYNPTPQNGPDMPMKWYKFLIYFSLFAGAILNGISGLNFLTGTVYGSDSSLVYSVFDGLRVLDIIMGVGLLGFAVLAIYTRMRLAGYYSNAPKLICITYAASAVLNLIYIIGILVILPSYALEYINFTSTIANIVSSFIMVGANYVYFNKRSHLFVN